MSYRPSTASAAAVHTHGGGDITSAVANATNSAQLDGTAAASFSTTVATQARANIGCVGSVHWTTGDGLIPTAAETITIDGVDIYEWAGAGVNINVPIGATLSEALNNLATAINTSGTTHIVATLDAPAPASTEIILQTASAPGGAVISSEFPTYAASQIADIFYEWNAGQASGLRTVHLRVPITADNAAAPFDINLVGTAAIFDAGFVAENSLGANIITTATITIAGTTITIDPAAGITPLLATDMVYVTAYVL